MSKRNQLAYSIAMARAYEDFCEKTKQLLEDWLHEFYERHPVNHDAAHKDSLHNNVMRQLDYVLHKYKDMNHIAFIEMEKNSIDWLAQPYFRGEQGVRLSSIIEEYNYYYCNPTYTPSRACQDMFRISVQPVHGAESSWRSPPGDEWDAEHESQSKRSREA